MLCKIPALEPTHYDFTVERRLKAAWNFLLGVLGGVGVGFFWDFYSTMQICAAFMWEKRKPFLFMKTYFILCLKTDQLGFPQHTGYKLI